MRSGIWCLTGRSAKGRLCDSSETCMKGGQQPRILVACGLILDGRPIFSSDTK